MQDGNGREQNSHCEHTRSKTMDEGQHDRRGTPLAPVVTPLTPAFQSGPLTPDGTVCQQTAAASLVQWKLCPHHLAEIGLFVEELD